MYTHTHRATKRVGAATIVIALGLIGCSGGGSSEKSSGGSKGIDETAAKIGEMFGGDTGRAVGAGLRVGKSAASAMEQFTPEREYYVGRAAGAQIVHQYPLYEDEAANRYVNLVGRLLAENCDRPEVFAGYNFQILETETINAYAAPGAYIFITRGMLRLCDSEHELAAVLAHEVAHIEGQHALRSIKQSRWTQFAAVLAKEGAGQYSANAGGATDAMAPVFAEMAGDVSQTLLVSGYSRELERAADKRGAQIMQAAGYDPAAMAAVLGKLDSATKPGGADFAATHPEPGQRVDLVNKQIGGPRSVAVTPALAQRFAAALAAARAK